MRINWKDRLAQLRKLGGEVEREHAVYFVPGVFFVVLGIMACAAPHLVIAVVAGLLVFCGAALCFLAYKFILFKRKIVGMLRQLSNSRVVIRTTDVENTYEYDASQEGKKIVFH
jgi:membrane protein implicated in regulation of membrane protease activity